MPAPNKLEIIFEKMATAIEEEDVPQIDAMGTEIQNLIDHGSNDDQYECCLRLLKLRYGLDIDEVDMDLEILCASKESKSKYGYLKNHVFSVLEDEHVLLYMQITPGGHLNFKTLGELVDQLDNLRARAYKKMPHYPAPAALQ